MGRWMIAAGCGLVMAGAVTAWAANTRESTISGNLRLELSGQNPVAVVQASGGDAVADVVSVTRAGETVPSKHLGAIHYEPLTVSMGVTELPNLLGSFLRGQTVDRMDGALDEIDANKVTNSHQMRQMVLSGAAFPALDASSKDPGYLQLTFQAEQITRSAASGGNATPGTVKKFICSNFRMTLTGLDCSHVSRIEPITITRKINASAPNSGPQITLPGPMDFGNLEFTVSESSAKDFYDWFDDFVTKGNNSAAREKTATVELLDQNLQTVLQTLTASGVGVFALHEKHEGSGNASGKVTLECYVKQRTLGANTPAAPGRMITPQTIPMRGGR